MTNRSNALFTLFPWSLYFLGRVISRPAVGIAGAVIVMFAARLLGRYRFKCTDWTQLTFFFLLLLGVYWGRNPWLIKYQSVLAPACFTLLSFGSLLIGRPFTADYARGQVPERFWLDPVFPRHFQRVNLILTSGWGVAFALAMFCASWEIRHPPVHGWWMKAIPWGGFILIFLGTRYFPYWYQNEVYAKNSSLFDPI